VGYNGKKLMSHPEIVVHCFPQWKKTSSVVSHNGGKPSPLYPTTQEMLLRCIPQWQKNSRLKYIHENKFFSKMILAHESGSKRISLMRKREKISWYYPFKVSNF
jgi:hypothetical protein